MKSRKIIQPVSQLITNLSQSLCQVRPISINQIQQTHKTLQFEKCIEKLDRAHISNKHNLKMIMKIKKQIMGYLSGILLEIQTLRNFKQEMKEEIEFFFENFSFIMELASENIVEKSIDQSKNHEGKIKMMVNNKLAKQKQYLKQIENMKQIIKQKECIISNLEDNISLYEKIMSDQENKIKNLLIENQKFVKTECSQQCEQIKVNFQRKHEELTYKINMQDDYAHKNKNIQCHLKTRKMKSLNFSPSIPKDSDNIIQIDELQKRLNKIKLDLIQNKNDLFK